MAFNDHFSVQASDYSRFRPHYPDELFTYLASLTDEHERAWDCATGNGQAAQGLSSLYKKTIATDASAAQIDNAVTIDKVTFMISPSESTPFKDNIFDLVTAAQALHWFDHDRFYNEVKRVLKPGGIIAAWCYSLFSINDDIDPLLKELHNETLKPYWPTDRQKVNEGYTSLPFPFEKIAAPVFNITQQWPLNDVIGYLGTWSGVRYYREQQRDPLPELYEKLKPYWLDENDVKQVNWPIHLKVGRV